MNVREIDVIALLCEFCATREGKQREWGDVLCYQCHRGNRLSRIEVLEDLKII